MINREKVIKGLECCAELSGKCSECPYNKGIGVSYCTTMLSKDALTLLKAQNAANNLDAAIRLVQKVTEDVRTNYEDEEY